MIVKRCAASGDVERRCKAKTRPARSCYQPKVGSRSSVKTGLTSDRLFCFLSLMSGEAVSDAPGDCRRHRQPKPDQHHDGERHYGVHGDLLPFSSCAACGVLATTATKCNATPRAARLSGLASGKVVHPCGSEFGSRQHAPLWWTDGVGQAVPSHLRLRGT
jgi:hypothetical protein